MTTNFSHMEKWPDIYEELLHMEDLMFEENKKGYTDKNLRVIGMARPVVEKMCHLLIEANGITDEQILTVMRIRNPHMQMGLRQCGLYGYILALQEGEYISEKTAKLLQKIRITANKATMQKSELYNKSPEELRQIAEEIYEALYRETYLFANQYMPEAQARANKQGKLSNRHNAAGKSTGVKSSVLGKVVTAAVIILFILVCIGLAIAIF